LVLWDIDLTLVDYSGTGARWYSDALTRVVGLPMRHVPEFAGRTERSLVVELFTAHGVDHDDDHIERFFAELTALASDDVPSLPTLGRALTGAPEILAALADRTDVVQSLVTGNLPVVAGHKLAAFGLDAYVDLAIGGYGSMSVHRHDLVGEAITLATAKHGGFDGVVVIGDSPNDVTAALHHEAVAIGVATGRFSAAQLTESGAHAVLPDLADTPAVLKTLLP
jgi:phosphoglycolate phosphatase